MATKKLPDYQIPVIIRRSKTEAGSPQLRFAVDGGSLKSERHLNVAVYKVAAALELVLAERGATAPVSVYAYDRRIVVEHSREYEIPQLEQAITDAIEAVSPLGVDLR